MPTPSLNSLIADHTSGKEALPQGVSVGRGASSWVKSVRGSQAGDAITDDRILLWLETRLDGALCSDYACTLRLGREHTAMNDRSKASLDARGTPNNATSRVDSRFGERSELQILVALDKQVTAGENSQKHGTKKNVPTKKDEQLRTGDKSIQNERHKQNVPPTNWSNKKRPRNIGSKNQRSRKKMGGRDRKQILLPQKKSLRPDSLQHITQKRSPARRSPLELPARRLGSRRRLRSFRSLRVLGCLDL